MVVSRERGATCLGGSPGAASLNDKNKSSQKAVRSWEKGS